LPNIGILVVGNEILDGLVLDTNSHWLINQLKALRMPVMERITVRDEVSEIARALRRLLEDGCDIVFTTGGLGPTHDDKTLRGVAMAFGLPLELNKEALAIVQRQYTVLHKLAFVKEARLTEARRKMAILPRGARPLDNRIGGAPAVLLEVEDSWIICLPGVPRELRWIFENEVIPLLRRRISGAFAERVIRIGRGDESTIAPILEEVMGEVPEVYIKSMVRPHGEGGIRLWVSAWGENQEEVEHLVEAASRRLIQRLGGEVEEGQPDG
jgi:molybdenum cofactor synthesis domain-containing protein